MCQSSFIVTLILLLLTPLNTVGGALAQPAQQKRRAQPKAEDFFTGPAFTFEQLLKLVGPLPDERLNTAIEKRGIDFEVTQEKLLQLKEAGAKLQVSRTLELFLQRHEPAKTPSPKPPEVTVLEVQCEPAECEISINGQSRRSTESGKLRISQLPFGKVVVDINKDGYIGKQIALDLRPGKVNPVAVDLEPDNTTKQKFGQELFSRVVVALGGNTGLTNTASIEATGAATLLDRDGRRSEWTCVARLRPPGQASVDLRSAGVDFKVRLLGGKAKSLGKANGTPEGRELESAIRLFRDYQLQGIVDRIKSSNLRLLATVAAPSGSDEAHLRAEGPTEAYDVTVLGSSFLPVRIKFEGSGGLESGLQVTYGDYVVVGKGRYPKQMIIKLPDAAQHGIDFRFDQVTTTLKFKEKDFRM